MTARTLRLKGMQRNESELLSDMCTATRPGPVGGGVDPETGLEAASGEVLIKSDMRCWLKMPSQSTVTVTAGDTVVVDHPMLALALGEPSLREGDIVRITNAIESSNVGLRLRIRSRQRGTYVTLARYQVEAVD